MRQVLKRGEVELLVLMLLLILVLASFLVYRCVADAHAVSDCEKSGGIALEHHNGSKVCTDFDGKVKYVIGMEEQK